MNSKGLEGQKMTDEQLHKLMAAILTASGNYDHPKQVVDEVKRLCDEVDERATNGK